MVKFFNTFEVKRALGRRVMSKYQAQTKEKLAVVFLPDIWSQPENPTYHAKYCKNMALMNKLWGTTNPEDSEEKIQWWEPERDSEPLTDQEKIKFWEDFIGQSSLQKNLDPVAEMHRAEEDEMAKSDSSDSYVPYADPERVNLAKDPLELYGPAENAQFADFHEEEDETQSGWELLRAKVKEQTDEQRETQGIAGRQRCSEIRGMVFQIESEYLKIEVLEEIEEPMNLDELTSDQLLAFTTADQYRLKKEQLLMIVYG